jgi:hypothetical protein
MQTIAGAPPCNANKKPLRRQANEAVFAELSRRRRTCRTLPGRRNIRITA